MNSTLIINLDDFQLLDELEAAQRDEPKTAIRLPERRLKTGNEYFVKQKKRFLK
jgi:hypothetical protein